jgi:uroporphyrinogen decarboxylase
MRDLAGNPERFAELLTGLFVTLDTDIVFPGSGLNTFAAEAIGGELSFREVCELGVRLSFALFEPLISRGLIDAVVIPDGAATLIPNDLYLEVVLPCERKLFDMVRARGIWCFLHQCGNIRSQLDLYPETGADCISVDAGVPIGDVYELYHRRLVTAGNVDAINTIFSGDPALICQAVSECVAAIADPFRRYILMPSCDLPPDTPLRNVKEFLASADLF